VKQDTGSDIAMANKKIAAGCDLVMATESEGLGIRQSMNQCTQNLAVATFRRWSKRYMNLNGLGILPIIIMPC